MAILADVDDFVVHNLFLPPKLPQGDYDASVARNGETQLFELALEVLRRMREEQGVDTALLEQGMALVIRSKTLHMHRTTGALRQVLEGITSRHDSVAIEITAQNAALMISRLEKHVAFEVFELAPSNAAVYSTHGRLIRTFPAATVQITLSDYSQAGFLDSLCQTITTMSVEPVLKMVPKARKTGVDLHEDRDTNNPAMVTELLVAVLASMGDIPQEVNSARPRLVKYTREEVLWHDARSPWRRSPVWMLIRVALNLTMTSKIYKKFMVRILSTVLHLSARREIDVRYTMILKIERRLKKLNLEARDSTLLATCEQLSSSKKQLADEWDKIQSRSGEIHNLDTLDTVEPEHSTAMALPSLDTFIEAIDARQTRLPSDLCVSHVPLLRFQRSELPELHNRDAHFYEHVKVNLYGFEEWVASNLQDWTGSQTDHATTSHRLARLMLMYRELAMNNHDDSPEIHAIIILTLFDLWVACDKTAILAHPMIRDYELGFNGTILETLILPRKHQMKRLRDIELYIERRQRDSRFKHHTLWSTKDASSFAARYIDESEPHKTLCQKIEGTALMQKQNKEAEYHRLKAEYHRYIEIAQQLTQHDTYVVSANSENDSDEEFCLRHCRKCNNERKAAGLKIEIHEWPLPASAITKKVVVFELNVPFAFSSWRDATNCVMFKVLRGSYASKFNSQYQSILGDKDQHLRAHACATTGNICLMSTTKPHIVTHRKLQEVSFATLDGVCLENGFKYEYFDAARASFVHNHDVAFDDDVADSWTYQLPQQSSILQKYMVRLPDVPDGQSPNTVIAKQHECPKHFTQAEYKALIALLYGLRLQWLNISLQLSNPAIDFKRQETTLVILQCIHQAGPSSVMADTRIAHDQLLQGPFASHLPQVLDRAVQRVKGNWESAPSFHSYVCIVLRLLSMHANPTIHEACLASLSAMRRILVKWMMSLKNKSMGTREKAERDALIAKNVEIALICIMSFDVDITFLEGVLGMELEASLLLQSAIVAKEGEFACKRSSDSLLPLLASRAQQVLYRCYPILSQTRKGLTHAVRTVWVAFQPVSEWQKVSDITDHWMTISSCSAQAKRNTKVHFNLLDGHLLVDGLPLDRPSPAVEADPMFETLFGTTIVEVMPSSIPGMQFSTRKSHAGQMVDFGLSSTDAQCLLAQATIEENGFQVFNLIPRSIFDGDLPDYFVRDFVHWYDSNHRTVQFRPQHEPWNLTSALSWVLHKDFHGRWKLEKEARTLIDFKSCFSDAISDILAPIAHRHRTHIFWNSEMSQVEIGFAHLQLGFTLQQSSNLLMSTEHRGMAVDADQRIGTLVGLESKLILRDIDSGERLILIPEGPLSYARDPALLSHVRVKVEKNAVRDIHVLKVDSRLNRLVDNGSIHGKIYIAYMHALTSFCLADPLTGLTGTEQSISILRSAAVRSFDRLQQETVDLLECIAKLSPIRNYYPREKKSMQEIGWSNKLGYVAQHNDFCEIVAALYDQVIQTRILYPEHKLLLPELDRGRSDLWSRASIRDAAWRLPGFGAEHQRSAEIDFTMRETKVNLWRHSEMHTLCLGWFSGNRASSNGQLRLNLSSGK